MNNISIEDIKKSISFLKGCSLFPIIKIGCDSTVLNVKNVRLERYLKQKGFIITAIQR